MLGGLPLFRDLGSALLAAVAAELAWLSLPGGALLFDEGEPSDCLYVVLSGCLGVLGAGGQLVGYVAPGHTVGEMGLISGRSRSARVVALRDTELARLSRTAFERMFTRHPEALLRISRVMVERLEAAQSGVRTRARPARTFTLVPHSLEVDAADFAASLVQALGRHGRAQLVWSVRGAEHTSHWFHAIEAANEFVVYVADPGATPWTRLCMRQADSLLLLARADAEPRPWGALEALPAVHAGQRRCELVLCHDGAVTAGAAARWLSAGPTASLHHLRGSEDVPRIARLITGRAIGLVLSGGGARGFAHIGALKALREAGIPIDLTGGTSMGGITAAGIAAGWDIPELTERLRRSFVDTNPLRDYTLPVVSLVSGRKVSALLRREFGELAIEDLPLPFFCVASNLTTGHSEVFRQGLVWRWLRASVAIPGVLPPVLHQGEVLVDGGAMNNLPVDCMRELDRGLVIGCDVGADRAFLASDDEMDVPPLWKMMSWLRRGRRHPNIFQILWRAGMVNSSAATAERRGQTDLLLQPPLAQIDMLNWKAFERAIDAGYEYTCARLAEAPAALRGAANVEMQ